MVEYKGKEYYVNYLSADYPTPLLLNRESWEITNEDGEELQIYQFNSANKKEREKVEENIKIFNEIIGFCIKKFNAYNPKL